MNIFDALKPEYGGMPKKYDYKDDYQYSMECIYCKGVYKTTGKHIKQMPLRCKCRPGAIGGSGIFDGTSIWRRLDDGTPIKSIMGE